MVSAPPRAAEANTPDHAGAAPDGWVIVVALLLLSLSAATGVYFRLIGLGVVPPTLALENVRHGHSHLVIFGWAIPAMFVALGRVFRPSLASRRGFGVTLASVFVFAVASWPLFLISGYGRTRVLGVSLPLSVMVSGFGMLAWYAWIVLYFSESRAPRAGTAAERLATASLAMLGASSVGAWSVAIAQAMGAGLRTTQFLTHAFLHLLALGFMGLGAFSLLLARSGSRRRLDRLVDLAAIGVLLSVLASSNAIDVPALQIIGRAGLVLSALCGLGLVFEIARCSMLLIWPAGVFAVARSGAELLLALSSGSAAARMLDDPSLRVLYLHVTLVAFASVAIIEAMVRPRALRVALVAALCCVALSIVPLSSVWPTAWGGVWAWWSAAAAGAVAGVAALALAGATASRTP